MIHQAPLILMGCYYTFHLTYSRYVATLLSVIQTELFDSESDIEENMSETEDNVKEDPDDEASSSDRMRALVLTLLLFLNH
ncbi:hypothetical protein JZ751_017006 [Albula glossodonta]|uniref:Uncharacterized protein n=1 Tax=Albula glossodonta TaxID=121402 RepID=A0A8T2MI29_9TELE|nr:hypothetical protein JZ751_017006 [Albula glossodonta]